jgi:hypothetical protein
MTEDVKLVEITAEEAEECLRAEGILPSPGRPKGTGFQRLDRPFHERMRQLIDGGFVSSRTAAAWKVVEHAPGNGTPESKVDRLVRGYPY